MQHKNACFEVILIHTHTTFKTLLDNPSLLPAPCITQQLLSLHGGSLFAASQSFLKLFQRTTAAAGAAAAAAAAAMALSVAAGVELLLPCRRTLSEREHAVQLLALPLRLLRVANDARAGDPTTRRHHCGLLPGLRLYLPLCELGARLLHGAAGAVV